MAQMVKVTRVFPYSNYAVVEWESNGHFKWVACWSPWIVEKNCLGNRIERRPERGEDTGEKREMYWGQGHYFENLEDALLYAIDEEESAWNAHKEFLEENL